MSIDRSAIAALIDTLSASSAKVVRDLLREYDKSANILRNVSSEWETTMNINEVTCHSRMIEGVLCRWWGDGETPPGVSIIDAAARAAKEPKP